MDSRIKIYDNFLSEKDYKFITDSLIGPFSTKFPWSYSGRVVPIENCMCDEIDDYQFVHGFYDSHKPQSDHINVIDPLIRRIPNLASLVKIKANLNPRHSKVITHGFHVDMTFKCTTGIYYLNTNNGYTEFEDGTKIENIKNRFVSFPSELKHTGSTCTDKRMRLLINFNYFEGELLTRGSRDTGDGYYHSGNTPNLSYHNLQQKSEYDPTKFEYDPTAGDGRQIQGEGLPPDVDMKDLQKILSSVIESHRCGEE